MWGAVNYDLHDLRMWVDHGLLIASLEMSAYVVLMPFGRDAQNRHMNTMEARIE